MTTKAHSTLTGSDLHEPKGVASAAATKVYIADGAGSGAWQKLTAVFHVQEQQSSGTNGGTFTSGSWQTRLLNTSVTNSITSASLASNQITLPAGTYWIDAWATAYGVGLHKLKLYNVTDASDVFFGSSARSGSEVIISSVKGQFTITGTKVFELRHKCAGTIATYGLGWATSFGTEIYSEAMIWKVLS